MKNLKPEANFPVLSANIESNELSPYLKKSVILDIESQRVGIIGYLTPSTKSISKPGNLSYSLHSTFLLIHQ